MKVVLILAPLVLIPLPAKACGPCGSGVDCQHRADICDQALWLDEYDCIAIRCATPCASWLSAIQSCADLPYESDCMVCMVAPDPTGCGAEVGACGADRTGGVTCNAWLNLGADGFDLLPYDSLDAAIALETCVCDGACGPANAGPCSSACGGDYLHPELTTNGCDKCITKTCKTAENACNAI